MNEHYVNALFINQTEESVVSRAATVAAESKNTNIEFYVSECILCSICGGKRKETFSIYSRINLLWVLLLGEFASIGILM